MLSIHTVAALPVGSGAMSRAKRIIAGTACIVALSGCGTSEDEQTSMNEFWGKETSDIGYTYDELLEDRSVVVQDLSVPVSGVDESESFTSETDWENPGYVILTACGTGDYLEDSDLLEFIVTAKDGMPEDMVDKAVNGDYWEWLTPGQCLGT